MRIDIASILNSQKAPTGKGSFNTTADSGRFHSIFGKSLQASAGKTSFSHQQASQVGEAFDAKDYESYLDALRSGLLARPVQNICIAPDGSSVCS